MAGKIINGLIGLLLSILLTISTWTLTKLIAVSDKLIAVEIKLAACETKPTAPQWLIDKVKRLEARIDAVESRKP